MLAYEAFISGSEMEAYLWERIVIMSVEDIGMGEPECSRFMYAYCRVKDQLRTGPKRDLDSDAGGRILCSCPKERGTS